LIVVSVALPPLDLTVVRDRRDPRPSSTGRNVPRRELRLLEPHEIHVAGVAQGCLAVEVEIPDAEGEVARELRLAIAAGRTPGAGLEGTEHDFGAHGTRDVFPW
jgi:hypothetical protein